MRRAHGSTADPDQVHSSTAPRRKVRRWLLGGLIFLISAGLAYSTWLYASGCAAFSTTTVMLLFMQIASSVAFLAVGSLIVLDQPQNRVGWLALWAAAGLTISIFDQTYLTCSAVGYRGLTPLPYVGWVTYSFGDFIVLIPIFVLLPLLFPTGRFLSRRWAAVALIGLAIQSILRLGMSILPDFRRDDAYGATLDMDNPLGVATLPDWWYPFFRYASVIVICALCLLAIASMVVRFRRSEGDERLQMKWLTYFFATVISVQILGFEVVGGLFYPQIFETIWYELLVVIVFVGYPLIIGVAILKYRLYDIDLIINRTVVYGGLTLGVVALYTTLVTGLGLLLHNENSFAASMLAVGVIAVAFQPARHRLQSAVNRWLYGERDDPAGVLTRVTSQLEKAESSSSLLATLVETVAASLKLPHAALWLQGEDGQLALTAQVGERPEQVESLPLVYQQEVIGQLVVAPRSRGETLSATDQQLLTSIARLTATTVRTIQLTDEVQAARVRTVSAREEERRRLRRDLHDGLGPVLASQGLKLAAARRLLRQDPESAERLLDDVLDRGERTVAEVRRLVYALRPPTLDELGLAEAIREHVETVGVAANLRIAVQGPETLPDIPAAVEVAAFRIVQEAVNNVIQHAQARHCTVTISARDDLRIQVQDDGVGLGADNRSGVGLISMRERAAEVGGTCTVESNHAAGGVVVSLSLPLLRVPERGAP